jgi:hypothetical protein
MAITGTQMKAAHKLLEWAQDDVGCASGVDNRAIVSFETGEQAPDRQTLSGHPVHARVRRHRIHSRRAGSQT